MTRRDSLKLFGLLGLRTTLPANLAAAEPFKSAPVKQDKAMAAATAAFGCDLFAKLQSKPGNLFYSPLSIEVALAMTAAGAGGKTLDEMAKVLQLPPSDPSAVGDLLRALKPEPPAKYELAIANALWLQQGMSFRQQFLAKTNNQFEAAMQSVDFAQTEKARQTINHWVEQQTKDKIKDLFAPGTLNADNRLVLTNAVYFKGDWTSPFDKRMTKVEAFHVTADKTVQAPLMRRHGRYRYYTGDGMQAVEMPYAGNRMSMLFLLPAAADGRLGLPFEAKLTADQLAGWVAKMAFKPGEVIIPRFKVTDEFDLGETLQGMGMKLAFTPAADFSGMCAEPLLISKVVHKAFVDTNEEGTEAAAATGVGMKLAAMPIRDEPFVFRADHPFLFVIRDIKANTPLFMGRVVNPMA